MSYNPFFKNRKFEDKPQVDIVYLYEKLTQFSVRKVGRIISCRCPIHNDTHPSFALYPETNSFYCFSCGVGGDAYTLIEKINNCGFKEALEIAKSL